MIPRLEQMDIEAPALPDSFVARWRDLEDEAHLPRAGLCAEEVLTQRNGRVWIVVRVDGRRYALIDRTDAEEAALDLWVMTGRERP